MSCLQYKSKGRLNSILGQGPFNKEEIKFLISKITQVYNNLLSMSNEESFEKPLIAYLYDLWNIC